MFDWNKREQRITETTVSGKFRVWNDGVPVVQPAYTFLHSAEQGLCLCSEKHWMMHRRRTAHVGRYHLNIFDLVRCHTPRIYAGTVILTQCQLNLSCCCSIELPSYLPRLIVINMKNDFILLRTLEFLLDDRTNNNCCASDWSILNITCTYLHCTFPKCRNLDFLSLWGMVWDRVFS